MTVKEMFVNAVLSDEKPETVTVEFMHGRIVTYPKNILGLLYTDSEIIHIVDDETGELLK